MGRAAAENEACRGRNINAGQACIASKRFIVVDAVAEEFERKFTEAVGALTGGVGADLVVEAVGEPETLIMGIELLRRGGTLLAFGVPHQERYDLPFGRLFFNEGQIITSVGPNVPVDFPKKYPNTTQAIVNAMVRALRLIQHSTPDQIVAAVPADYYTDKAQYKAALEKNIETYQHDGAIGMDAAQAVYRDLKTFDPQVQSATVDLAKTVDMKFQQKAAQKYK